MSLYTLATGVQTQLNRIGKIVAELNTKESEMWERTRIEKRLILIEEYKHFKLLLDNFYKTGNEIIDYQTEKLTEHVRILKSSK
jgi:hypothetical protein